MKLATIRRDGGTTAARIDGETAFPLPYEDVGELLAAGDGWQERAGADSDQSLAVADLDFAPLVLRPEKIFCVGLNYRAHAEEAKREIPEHPVIFAKFWRSLIGARDDLVLPANSDKVDWEVEVAVIIGKPARGVAPADSLDHVAGYTIINDISMRDWQRRTTEMLQGKTFEKATPLGPALVTPDEVDHASSLEITCSVDDEVRQHANTDDMVFKPADIISYISNFISLMPGDVIATGTPSGVGGARRPEVFLEAGQLLRTAAEGLGEQLNPCVAASRA